MKIVIVGNQKQRRALRSGLERSGLEIAGDFASLADARRAGVDADAVVRSLAEDDSDREPTFAEPLTPRELEVLEFLSQGLANKGIADRLGISDQTVKFHLASIIGKLGAANRTDAVRLAVRRGLVAL